LTLGTPVAVWAADASKHADEPAGASAPPPAAEPASAGLDHQAVAPDGDGKAPSAEGPNSDGSAARSSADSAGGEGMNAAPIDTRISVQPHRPLTGTAAIAVKPKRPAPAAYTQPARTLSSPRALSPPMRNAVGLSLPRGAEAPRRNGGPLGVPAAARSAGATRAGTTAIQSATASVHAGHPPAMPLNRPAVVNRGAINGTGLMNRGPYPGGIGGPAARLAGINGTAIRARH
jgi:hypothetical protein